MLSALLGCSASPSLVRLAVIPLIALLLSSCNPTELDRVVCGGERFLVFTVYRSGGVGVGSHEYHPGVLPSWARNLHVDDRIARIETLQRWSGLDDQGSPTSGREANIYEFDRIARVMRTASYELTDPDHDPNPPWEEELPCEPFSDFELMMVYVKYFAYEMGFDVS